MRRYYLLLVILSFALVALVSAQSGEPLAAAAEARIVISAEMVRDSAPSAMIGGRTIPVQLQAVSAPQDTFPSASDGCVSAATSASLELPINAIASGPTVVNSFSSEVGDPDISSCMAGTPTSVRGYRTAWYHFIAPITGRLIVEAVPNFDFDDDYDTVIVIYEGEFCEDIVLRTCNDDFNGFLSRAEYDVIQGQTYYIEIADRQLGVNGTARVNLQAGIQAREYWEGNDDWNLGPANRSRHIAAVVGSDIYIIGGQTTLNDVTPIRTGSVARFDTLDGTWEELAPMPPTCDPDGYSNTEAAVVNNKIFLPSGYVGDNNTYSGIHCVYDIASDTWTTAAAAPWAVGPVTHAPVIGRAGASGYFVVGGLNGPFLGAYPQTQARAEVYFYAANVNIWLSSLPPMPGERYAHTGTLLSDRFLCVTGGLRPDPDTPGSTFLLLSGDCLDLTNTANGWQPIAALNIPRFSASSAIGPDGRWYIIGGVTATSSGLRPVAEIEVYDQLNNRWELLDRRFNLNDPARAWSSGGFVDDDLWVVGGETWLDGPGWVVTGIIEKMRLPGELVPAAYLPLVRYDVPFRIGNEPDNAPQEAWDLTLNFRASSNFNDPTDRFDMYRFALSSARPVSIQLEGIPSSENYDLYLYNEQKVQLAASTNISNLDETIDQTLAAGTYYVLVVAHVNNPLVLGTYFLTVYD